MLVERRRSLTSHEKIYAMTRHSQTPLFVLMLSGCISVTPPSSVQPLVVANSDLHCIAAGALGEQAVCLVLQGQVTSTCLVNVGEYTATSCIPGYSPWLSVGELLVLQSATEYTARGEVQGYVQISREGEPQVVPNLTARSRLHSSSTFAILLPNAGGSQREQCWLSDNAQLHCRRYEGTPDTHLIVVDGEPTATLRVSRLLTVYPSRSGDTCLFASPNQWLRGDCVGSSREQIGRAWLGGTRAFYEEGVLDGSEDGHVAWVPFDDTPVLTAHFPDLRPLLGAVRVGDHLLLSSADKSLWVEFSTLEPIE